MREFTSVKDAAFSLGLSESYIVSHIKKGFIDSNRFGYIIRPRASEGDVFLLPFKRS
jgi:hypothetical protein